MPTTLKIHQKNRFLFSDELVNWFVATLIQFIRFLLQQSRRQKRVSNPGTKRKQTKHAGKDDSQETNSFIPFPLFLLDFEAKKNNFYWIFRCHREFSRNSGEGDKEDLKVLKRFLSNHEEKFISCWDFDLNNGIMLMGSIII